MNDDFHPRGCAMGFLVAGLLWVLIFGGLAVLFVTLVRS